MAKEDDDVCREDQRTWNLDLNKPDWSMVVIRDSSDSVSDDLAVFPPINHENLLVSSFSDGYDRNRDSPSDSSSPSSSSRRSPSSSSSSSSCLLSPSDTDGQSPWTASDFDRKLPGQSSELDDKPPRSPSDFDEGSPPSHTDGKALWKPLHRFSGLADEIRGWWELLLVLVRTKLQKMATWFSVYDFSSVTGILWSFYPAMAVAIWWWMRVRARRRWCKGETADQLRAVIKEKDERIAQLLNQIARMNELLVKHHKEIVSRTPN